MANESVVFYLQNVNGPPIEKIYWDDTYLYKQILKGLDNCRKNCCDSIASIGIDTWGPDGQFINTDGEMLGKVCCYRDHRLDRMTEILTAKISPSRIYEITGIQFQPFNISNQLLWFMLNRSYMLKPGYIFLPMPTIFYHYLGGEIKIDTTWASVTQLMDTRTKEWSEEILTKLNIPRDILPEIVPPGTVTGKLFEPIADLLHLNRSKLIAVASHDTASAFAAAPVKHPDSSLIISSGTWSLIGKIIGDSITSPEAMEENFSNEGGIGNIRFLKNCMGLWLEQELRRMWRNTDGREMDWNEATRLVKKAPPFTAFIDPDCDLFYNPKNMEDAISDYCSMTGQKAPADRGAFLRLVYESLAMKYRMVNEKISKITGKPSKTIHIIGGGCNNELLNQFTSDALGLPVSAGPEEATALGNIMVQAKSLNLIPGLETTNLLISDMCTIKEYRPKYQTKWDIAYEQFEKILSRRRGIGGWSSGFRRSVT